MVRSYSRIAGCRSEPATTGTSGWASDTSSTVARSWAGLRKDHRYDTAMASTPSSSTSRRP